MSLGELESIFHILNGDAFNMRVIAEQYEQEFQENEESGYNAKMLRNSQLVKGNFTTEEKEVNRAAR